MIAVELSTKDITEIIFERMLQKGFFIGTVPTFNVLRFYPALTISKDDILSMCKALKDVLRQVGKEVKHE